MKNKTENKIEYVPEGTKEDVTILEAERQKQLLNFVQLLDKLSRIVYNGKIRLDISEGRIFLDIAEFHAVEEDTPSSATIKSKTADVAPSYMG